MYRMKQKYITNFEDNFYYFDNNCTMSFSMHINKRPTVHILCWC